MRNSDKKITFLTFGDIPYDQRMQRIWKTLYSAGFEIQIIGRLKYQEFNSEYPYSIHRMRLWFEKGPMAYLEYNLRAFFKLLFKKISILYAVDLDTMPAAALLHKMKSGKLIYDAHEYFTETPEVSRRPFVKRVWSIIARWSIPTVDLAFSVSSSIAEALSSSHKIDFHVVRNVPYYTLSPKKEISEKYILYQGAVNEGRGLEQLIKAINNTNYSLLIAGKGDLDNEIASLIEELKLADRVKMTGYVSPAKLKSLTENAWIGVNFLENKSLSYYYSLANKYFDYMMAGIPQICMNFPEYHLINTQYPFSILIDDLNKQTILNALSLCDEVDLYQNLVKQCHQAAKAFNWEKESHTLISLTQKLID